MHDYSRQVDPDQPAIRPWWQRRWFKLVTLISVVAFSGLFIAAEYVLHHAEPILRQRIVETLSARFDAPVELDRIEISLFRGIEVNGFALRIPLGAEPGTGEPAYPLIAVQHFSFRTTVRGLLHEPTHIAGVQVDGMELHIPPPGQRAQLFGSREGKEPADLNDPKLKPKVAILVRQLHCRNVRLFLESGKPGKLPLEFNVASLEMQEVGRDQSMLYDAQLTSPKPAGRIHAVGHFGPWAGGSSASREPAAPGQTPLDGDYTFDHADLNTIKGIGGTLSSRGHFAGVLDGITIDGTTDVPNFSLDSSDRPISLQTRFHALVDGTSGDTYLERVQARLGTTDFTVTGKVVKVDHQGHDIQLDVDIPHGSMQEFLRLAVKTNPPLMNGLLQMKARLHIPPGDMRVPQKLSMVGAFHLTDVRFNNPNMQDQVDALSARAQGRPQQVEEVSRSRETEVHSRLEARFTLGHGLMEITDIQYAIPGATVLLNGVYSMDGRLFEFKGHVRTEATASQMVTGWKRWLLKPADGLLQMNGAGVELPIEISGTQGDMHVGLAMNGVDDTPKQMFADLKGKDLQNHKELAARRLTSQADQEDLEAARASTMEGAQRAHDAAVRHRAEAGQLLGAARDHSATTQH